MCYVSLQLNSNLKNKQIKKTIKPAKLADLVKMAKISIDEIMASNGKYPGINIIVNAVNVLEELKEKKGKEELELIKMLENAIAPHLIDVNPENYW